MAPKFSFNSIDDSTVIFNNNTFHDRYVLIDFWATWCAPCLREISYIEKTYQKFHALGLEVLSVSLDVSSRMVQNFRKSRNSMPWKNAHVPVAKQSDVSFAFNIAGFPTPILVSRTGKIVEIGDNLRGEQLEKTMAKYISIKER